MDSGDEPLPMIKRGPFSMPIGGPFSTPIDMHLGDSFRHRGEKIADLGSDIFACEIGVPIDSVLAPDVAGIDANELHFLYSEAGAGDDVGLDGEIVQMFGFDPGA